MRLRGIPALLGALVTVLVLTACAGMPTGGEVRIGRDIGDVDDSIDLSFLAAGPQQGATPEQIVSGFVAAGTSPAGDWAIARQFLSPTMAETWDPYAGVTIDELAGRTLTASSDTSVTMTVDAVADVDATGAYGETDAGAVPLTFTLAQRKDGEWRITKAEDGIVLDREFFPQIFRSYSLMYFDPSWTYLVPDMRWFPARTNTAARIVQELIDGTPSPWLSGAVVSAFAEDITAPGSVPLVDGVARVDVSASALALPQTQLDRMQAQLRGSLASANISAAVMTVGSVVVEATPTPTRSTRPDVRPAVLTEAGFGFLAGDELEPIPGISEGMQNLAPTAIELGPDLDVAAVRVDGGAVVRLRDDQQNVPIDDRAGLIAPTVDGYGYIWTVPTSHPTDVRAYAPDGSTVEVADAWSGAARIWAMQLSRDGTRMLAVVTSGGHSEAWVAGVIRDGERPVRLGAWARLTVLPGGGVDAAWLDDTTVGIVARVGGEEVIVTQKVGGLTSSTTAPDGVVSIAGASQLTGVRLAATDGIMYVRAGTRWQENASGILVLAKQQGAPR